MTMEEMFDTLEDFYGCEIPEYVMKAGKTFFTIQLSDWQGERQLKVTLTDVIEYYATHARNYTSGIRTLAGYSSDWRGVDNIASEALGWFKHVNRTGLAREARKHGMSLVS